MEIIGAYHRGENLKNGLISYIDSKYPDLESMMLELPPGYKKLGESDLFPLLFFDEVASYYEEKGVHIIPGDRKYLDVYGWSLDEALDKMQEDPNKYSGLLAWKSLLAFFNGKLIRHRNKGLNEAFTEEQPEVSVVGGLHGKYLKNHNPDSYFSLFAPHLISPGIRDPINLIISRSADKVHRFEVENSSPTLPGTFSQLVIIGAYLFSDKIGQGVEYVGALRNKGW